MVFRNMVRGYSEEVYYAETAPSSYKIMKLEFHPNNIGEITQKEIFTQTGSQIVAFETDSENI